jgi:hypothetical protein
MPVITIVKMFIEPTSGQSLTRFWQNILNDHSTIFNFKESIISSSFLIDEQLCTVVKLHPLAR